MSLISRDSRDEGYSDNVLDNPTYGPSTVPSVQYSSLGPRGTPSPKPVPAEAQWGEGEAEYQEVGGDVYHELGEAAGGEIAYEVPAESVTQPAATNMDYEVPVESLAKNKARTGRPYQSH